VDAQLQGASLDYAQLQGVSFTSAQLQGASLAGAELQGVSFTSAQLQGASLAGAQLQGASLDEAQLQGASLVGAQLQGASLDYAQLQGASLDAAQLQGTSLRGARLLGASLSLAHLQGASLADAQLDGALLTLAAMEATDLSGARLWRTNSQPRPLTVVAIQMSGVQTWLPEQIDLDGELHPWDGEAYQALRTSVESFSTGENRDRALERIQRLDCPSPDKTLASCDPNTPPPLDATEWRKALEAASISEEAYADALAKTLKGLVCLGDADSIHVVRGTGFRDRLVATRLAAADLIDSLTSKDRKDCAVAAVLTDVDRANLLQLRQQIEEAGK
jgi:hypothetical protein